MRNPTLIIRLSDYFLKLIQVFLLLRFVCKFLGITNNNSFAHWLYSMTQPLLLPVVRYFPSPPYEGKFTLEFSVIFAIIFYAVLGYLFVAFLGHMGKNLAAMPQSTHIQPERDTLEDVMPTRSRKIGRKPAEEAYDDEGDDIHRV